MSDERLKKVLGEGRESRSAYDRAATESRELSDDDRVEMFRQQFIQAALPDLPKIPGYHFDAPNDEEARLADTNETFKEQAQRMGSRMDEGDGMSAMRESAKVRAPQEW